MVPACPAVVWIPPAMKDLALVVDNKDLLVPGAAAPRRYVSQVRGARYRPELLRLAPAMLSTLTWPIGIGQLPRGRQHPQVGVTAGSGRGQPSDRFGPRRCQRPGDVSDGSVAAFEPAVRAGTVAGKTGYAVHQLVQPSRKIGQLEARQRATFKVVNGERRYQYRERF